MKLVAMLATVILSNSVRDAKTTTSTHTTPNADHESATSVGVSKPTSHKGRIKLKALNPSIQEYVRMHFPQSQMRSAAYDPMCNGDDAIDLSITTPGQPQMSLIFSPNGTFIQQEQDLNLTSIPSTITTSLRQSYPGFRIHRQCEKLTLAGGAIQYSFDLSKAGIQKEVVCDDHGTVLCEHVE